MAAWVECQLRMRIRIWFPALVWKGSGGVCFYSQSWGRDWKTLGAFCPASLWNQWDPDPSQRPVSKHQQAKLTKMLVSDRGRPWHWPVCPHMYTKVQSTYMLPCKNTVITCVVYSLHSVEAVSSETVFLTLLQASWVNKLDRTIYLGRIEFFFSLLYLAMAGSIKRTFLLPQGWHLPFPLGQSSEGASPSPLHSQPSGKVLFSNWEKKLLHDFFSKCACGCLMASWPTSKQQNHSPSWQTETDFIVYGISEMCVASLLIPSLKDGEKKKKKTPEHKL